MALIVALFLIGFGLFILVELVLGLIFGLWWIGVNLSTWSLVLISALAVVVFWQWRRALYSNTLRWEGLLYSSRYAAEKEDNLKFARFLSFVTLAFLWAITFFTRLGA